MGDNGLRIESRGLNPIDIMRIWWDNWKLQYRNSYQEKDAETTKNKS